MSERQETDSFLTDFSRAWGPITRDKDDPVKSGVPDYIPQYVMDEATAYFKQQKATSTTVDFGYAVHVVYDDQSDRVGISTGRGFAEIARSQCAAIGRLLISLAAPASPQSPGAQTVGAGEMIPKGIDPATWNGMTPMQQTNYKRNQAGLEYALKQDRQRQDAAIQQNRLEAEQRRHR